MGQCLLETVLNVPKPNDYPSLTSQFAQRGLSHNDIIKAELEAQRKPGTQPRMLSTYVGRYWNTVYNVSIHVTEHFDQLKICFQSSNSEIYDLEHYEDDMFSWLLMYNQAMSRGRYVTDFKASYYLMSVDITESHDMNTLRWA